jgi:hypothetical protein
VLGQHTQAQSKELSSRIHTQEVMSTKLLPWKEHMQQGLGNGAEQERNQNERSKIGTWREETRRTSNQGQTENQIGELMRNRDLDGENEADSGNSFQWERRTSTGEQENKKEA